MREILVWLKQICWYFVNNIRLHVKYCSTVPYHQSNPKKSAHTQFFLIKTVPNKKMNSHSCRQTIPGRRPDHGDTMAIRTSTTQNRDNANPPTAGECHYALLLAATAGCMTHDALSAFQGFYPIKSQHVPTFEIKFRSNNYVLNVIIL